MAKIVLMGEDMPMLQEIYFTSVNGDVIVNADATSNRISAARKVPRSGKFTPALSAPRDVASLVRLLGAKPDSDLSGTPSALGLSYSQVVSVLYGMCKEHDIEASFVLQPPQGMQTIGETGSGSPRPDLPEESHVGSAPVLPTK